MAVAEQEREHQIPERDPEPSPGKRLYQFSGWLHVGPGAEECSEVDEEKGEVECSNPRHFHAWCRVPNQYEARDIAEKALAGKARKARQLRDPETNAYEILEDELDTLARGGDSAKADLVTELLLRDWWKDYQEAEREVLDLESDQPDADEKKYAHIKEDEKRYDELLAMDEEDRPGDEFGELEKHIAGFHDEIKARHNAIQESKREPLMKRDLNDLIDQVRDERIKAASADEFHHVKRSWELVYGVLRKPVVKGKKPEQVWGEPDELRHAADEVLAAANMLFDDLERMENGNTGPS
jgi:hypothetical protein